MQTKQKRYSLISHIRLGAFALFALFICLQAVLFLFLWKHTSLQETQRAEWSRADSLAADVSAFLYPELDFRRLREYLDGFLRDNLNRDVHLLDSEGRLLHSFSRVSRGLLKEKVPLDPIRRFLEESGRSQAPILGQDPYSGQNTALFSVAKIILPDGQPGYLYLNLENGRAQRIRDKYIDRGAILAVSLSTFLASLASLLLGLVLFRPIRQRISRFVDTIRAYSSGDLSAQVRVEENDELGELESTFNQLLNTVNASFGKLEQKDALRRELVENIWHDIRGPVAALRAVAEKLQQQSQDATFQETLNAILGNANHLSRFLLELQEVSELDLGQRTPEFIPTDLIELADETVASLTPEAQSKEISLRVVSSLDSCHARIDPSLFARMLRNLLENSLKYSGRGSTVEIQIQATEKRIEIAVQDSGPGISAKDLPHLFERRFRGEQGQGTFESRGLGLAIVKKIAEAHKVPLEVTSAEGKGSRFSLTLEKYLPIFLFALLPLSLSPGDLLAQPMERRALSEFERSPVFQREVVFQEEVWSHNLPSQISPQAVSGDFNGDGKADLLAFHLPSQTLHLADSDGKALFQSRPFGTLPSGVSWESLRSVRLQGESAHRLITPFGDAHAVWLSKIGFPLQWERKEVQGDGGRIGSVFIQSPSEDRIQTFVTPRIHSEGSIAIGIFDVGSGIRLQDRVGYQGHFLGILNTTGKSRPYLLFRNDKSFSSPIWGYLDEKKIWHQLFRSPRDLSWGKEEILDVNGDGVQEILLPGRNLQGSWLLSLYGKSAVAMPVRSLGDKLRKRSILAVGDFHGSGREDLAVLEAEGIRIFSPQTTLSAEDLPAVREHEQEVGAILSQSGNETPGPFLCNGFQENGELGRTASCAAGYAFLEIDDGGPPPTGTCCKLPAIDILSGKEVIAKRRCPDNSILVGVSPMLSSKAQPVNWESLELHCAFINTDRYTLGPPTAGESYGDSSSITTEIHQKDRDRLPLGIRFGAGRIELSLWDSDGCIGREAGEVLLAIQGPHCRDMLFAHLQRRNSRGHSENLQMFPRCREVSDIYDPSRGCRE